MAIWHLQPAATTSGEASSASSSADRSSSSSCTCWRPGEAYGYEIVSKLTAETNGALEVTDGTLYPVLYRLERAGFVAVRWETPERGVPRKYYPLTDAGARSSQRLTHEWTTFAKAMAKLLRRRSKGEGSSDDHDRRRLRQPRARRAAARDAAARRRSRWSCEGTSPSGWPRGNRWRRCSTSSAIRWRWPSRTCRPCRWWPAHFWPRATARLIDLALPVRAAGAGGRAHLVCDAASSTCRRCCSSI